MADAVAAAGAAEEARRAFILRQTAIAAPPLVPEVRLHLASEVTPLWEASEAELARAGVPPPYWAFAWAGGQALARHVLDRPEVVAGKRVLDLASGSGLLAIAATLAGAAEVTAADVDPFSAAAIALNAAENGVDVAIVCGDLTGEGAEGAGQWDVVLAGDICYERGMAERLVGWLRMQAARGAEVLVGDPGRAYCPAEGIEEVARRGVPTSVDLEGCEEREGRVIRICAERWG
ncbi:MAG: methyltransferase [Polyangiaceae bacterium]|nr:methyltransferase [Polyangiaceae bacterium]